MNQDRLSCRKPSVIKERLPCGQPDQRHPGSSNVIEGAWLRSQIGCACNGILCCRTASPEFSERVDGLAECHIGDAAVNFSGHAGEIVARNGQMTVNPRWSSPGFRTEALLQFDDKLVGILMQAILNDFVPAEARRSRSASGTCWSTRWACCSSLWFILPPCKIVMARNRC